MSIWPFFSCTSQLAANPISYYKFVKVAVYWRVNLNNSTRLHSTPLNSLHTTPQWPQLVEPSLTVHLESTAPLTGVHHSKCIALQYCFFLQLAHTGIKPGPIDLRIHMTTSHKNSYQLCHLKASWCKWAVFILGYNGTLSSSSFSI